MTPLFGQKILQVRPKSKFAWAGWTRLEKPVRLMPAYQSFAEEIHKEGIDRVLVLGMGGSSLTAEVFSSLLAAANIEAPSILAILDSTDPEQVAQAAKIIHRTKVYILLPVNQAAQPKLMAAFDYFWEFSKGDGSRFVATTDPGTSLEALARENANSERYSLPTKPWVDVSPR